MKGSNKKSKCLIENLKKDLIEICLYFNKKALEMEI